MLSFGSASAFPSERVRGAGELPCLRNVVGKDESLLESVRDALRGALEFLMESEYVLEPVKGTLVGPAESAFEGSLFFVERVSGRLWELEDLFLLKSFLRDDIQHKFYTPVDVATQQLLLQQVYELVVARSDTQCSFLTPPPLLEDHSDIRVIYRHYATLYFVFVVDQQESELGILDLIQVFVQVLNTCFRNVSELDLVFGWQVLEAALEEIVQGGMVIDTSIKKIVAAIDDANKQQTTITQKTWWR